MAHYFGGSDGGYYPPPRTEQSSIGYTDGCPFIFRDCPAKKKKEEKTEEKFEKSDCEKKILGYTYGYMANRGEYRSPQGIKSQEKLYELGNNWVCLAIANYQKTFYSTDIYSDYKRTPTERDIKAFVERAHNKKVKVCLKPMLNSEDNMWRAHIGFPDLNMSDMDIYWNKWFESYTNYITYYAELAEELGCEMFCIGCEMLGTEHRKEDWIELIKKIRGIYSGKLVYNTNHDHEDTVEWFDMLDYIGTSAYYPVGDKGINRESLMKEWEKIKWRLNAIADSRHKKYIFMEIGCRSATSSSATPWDFTLDLPWNEDEQALFYETCFDTFMNEERFAGVFWWDWSTFIYDDRKDAEKDLGFNIHLKKAEKVVKKYYKEYR